ncbi:MAG: hypothetical protein ACKODK_19605 [Opitutaceae bacterium]
MKRLRLGLVLPGLITSAVFSANTPAVSPANRVEPLSIPLRLSMTADEVVAALGKPGSDNRAFGGGMGYAGLRVMFDTRGKEIWSATIDGDARLAGGIGVGDPLSKVKAEFPGGNMVYDSYDVTAGQYALSFRAPSGTVDRIVIRPSGRRFMDFAPAAKGAPKAPAIALAALVGQWIDPKNAQSFEIFADGLYRTGVGGEGRVTTSPEGLVFSGVLSAWYQGRATLSADRKVIEFYWTNADGSRNYFAFLRASP